MKNLMIYNKVKIDYTYMYGEDLEIEEIRQYMRLQVDHSLDNVDWKVEDIIIACNFDFEYRGVKNVHLENIAEHNQYFNKFYGIQELYDKGILTEDVWFHDLDCFQIKKFDFPKFDGDMGLCIYVGTPEYNTCSMFLKPSCKDMIDFTVDFMESTKLNPVPNISDENVIIQAIRLSPMHQGRHTRINNTYNCGLTHFEKRYEVSEKPIHVIGFKPTGRKGWDTYVEGKNSAEVVLVPDTLKALFEKYNLLPGEEVELDPIADREEILKGIPDKKEFKNTTTLKMKEDLIDFFGEEYKDKNVTEIGTSHGWTSRLLSFLFKTVYAIDNKEANVARSKEINDDRGNINHILGDVYEKAWTDLFPRGEIDVFFIDCDHSYQSVVADIQNAISMGRNDALFVFDDYGHPTAGVKMAVNNFINDGKLSLVKYVGHPAGTQIQENRDGILDWEGVICKLETPTTQTKSPSKSPSKAVWWTGVKPGNDYLKSKLENGEWMEYSRRTWEYWCDKNNYYFIPLEEVKESDTKTHRVNWQRWFHLRESGILEKYDQVLSIDASIMVRWDAPDLLELTDNKWTALRANENWRWVHESVDGYKELFPDVDFEYRDYFGSGFVALNKSHIELLKEYEDYYWENWEKIVEYQDKKVQRGTEQPVLNYFVQKSPHKLNFFSIKNGITHMPRHQVMQGNWHYEDPTPFYLRYFNVWIFSGFPDRGKVRNDLMSKTWEMIKQNYV